jgi:hypothetical protein
LPQRLFCVRSAEIWLTDQWARADCQTSTGVDERAIVSLATKKGRPVPCSHFSGEAKVPRHGPFLWPCRANSITEIYEGKVAGVRAATVTTARR